MFDSFSKRSLPISLRYKKNKSEMVKLFHYACITWVETRSSNSNISNHRKSPNHFAKAATLHSSYHYPLPINALVMVRCDLCQICHYGTLEFDLYPLYTLRSTPIRSQANPDVKASPCFFPKSSRFSIDTENI